MQAKLLLFSAAAAVLPFVPAARGNLLLYEPFDYTASPHPTTWDIPDELAKNFPTNAGDPIPTWIDYYGGNPTPYISSGSLSYPGLADPNPGTNSATYHGYNSGGVLGTAYHYFGQPATWDGSSQPPFATYSENPTTPTTLYYSALLRVNQIGSASGITVNGTTVASDGWNNPSSTGQYLMGFTDRNTYQSGTNGKLSNEPQTAAALMIRPTDLTDHYVSTYQIGIGASSVSGYYPASTYGLGDTLFVVVAYTMNPGSTSNVAKLYIDPTPGSLESDNTVSAQTPDGSAETAGDLAAFFLKEAGNMPDYGLQIDDLRLGTTWADVTPAVPEPAAISLLGGSMLLALSRRRRHANIVD